MPERGGRRRTALRTVLLICAAVGLMVLAWQACRVAELSKWSTWVNKVEVLGQPGSDAKLMVRWLGPPTSVEQPQRVIGGSFRPPVVSPPPTADEAYVYIRSFSFGVGVWVAYIFI